uniref:Secreted protein n=1 Tax=Thraustotheca clavata TaxID=74557 RepID=A0A0A7CMF0_9STRA|nr:secreted protein [Thraustotheca clavata]
MRWVALIALVVTPPVASLLVNPWDQCGGEDYLGSNECVAGHHCVHLNDLVSQCLPHTRDEEVSEFGQCGGKYYIGGAKCTAGTTCTRFSEWYSQCLPDVAAPLNWADSEAICFIPDTHTKVTALPPGQVLTLEACMAEAAKQHGHYANWKIQSKQCTILNTASNYYVDYDCKGAVKYDLKKWACSGNSDFPGNDIKTISSSFEQCESHCAHYTGETPCTAFTNKDKAKHGECTLKSFDDPNRPPSQSWIGGFACKTLPK